MRIALGIEYNGSQFHGWQTQQPGVRCVQHTVEAAVAFVADHPVELVCAGRTDKGVHATQQVVHFDTPNARPEKAWVLGVNSRMPRDVAVSWACEVPDDFHARYSAVARRYRYFVLNRRSRSAVMASQMTWHHYALDAEKMNAAAALLLGEHDFSAFRASECQAAHPRRTVLHARVSRHGDIIVFDVKANAFLMHMVRNMMGVLLEIGEGLKPVDWVADVLQGRDRRRAGVTAPPDGLYLVDVEYPDGLPLPRPPIGPHFMSAFANDAPLDAGVRTRWATDGANDAKR